jgi:lysophospholipase L1-like esterase
MKRLPLRTFTLVTCLALSACSSGPREKVQFVYVTLGASEASGVGATRSTEGYVFLIKRELDRRIPGVFLINFGVPGARIDVIKEQVQLAKESGTKANLVTVWMGANDLIHGDDPIMFRQDLRVVLGTLRDHVSKDIVIANLPNLTHLPRFQRDPNPLVSVARITDYNEVIEAEARDIDATLVDLFTQPIRRDMVLGLDGFHPSDAGHREIARLFLQAIFLKLGVT